MKSRLVGLLCAAILLPLPGAAQPIRENIHDNWEFRQGRGYNWYPASVPGTVHTDLMTAGIIEDPYFRLNERAVQWVDKEEWIYRTTFDVGAELFAKDNISLIFEGLDTYADVTLNGVSIIKADNMFCEWPANVKSLLRKTGNELEVKFRSATREGLRMWETTPWRDIIESGNDQSANGGLFSARVGVFVRKAGYHFGWDWGPRLVTSGIWKPVYLEAWNDAKLDDVFYRQVAVDSTRAEIEVTVETALVDGEIIVRNLTDNRVVSRGKYKTTDGRKAVNFTVDNPRLWWTNGLGEPFLYEFEVELRTRKGKVLDRHRQKLGLRSIRVVTEPDEWGESFYFEMNGVPVFMKGANYIPLDVFVPRVTDEIYERTIRDAAAANMNMLRVWGGGIYENDVFYDLCDEYGILVWQDFMFSCALYPAEGELMENIKVEARQNVRRLRNHTCMAVWCGNNECLDMWANWGVKRRYERTNPEWAEIQWRQFTDLYYKVLPEIVAAEHPGIAYRKSSPYSFDDGRRSDSIGDYHDWDVWGQALEFDRFNHIQSRFFSEYGFQGFPSFQSIRRFAPEERDWSATSEVMLSHQRAGTNGNQKINSMMLRDYGEPKDFESFTYMSQLMQADAMRIAMESHRRQMPRCMGSLIWQHNDCWPVASWSSIDYYGTWKAQQYAIKRAFEDVIVSAGPEGIFIITDKPLRWRSATFDWFDLRTGERLWGEGMEMMDDYPDPMKPHMQAGTTHKIKDAGFAEKTKEMGKRWEDENVVLHIALTDESGKVYENFYYPAKHKDMNYAKPTIEKKFAATDGGYEVTLSSDVFARGVYIVIDGMTDYSLSDNFFDMMPGQAKTVRISTSGKIDGIENRLRIITYADARK